MPTGTVTGFNLAKGFGFIEPSDGGKPVFFDRFGVVDVLDPMADGQSVQYELMTDKRGRVSAGNVRLLQ